MLGRHKARPSAYSLAWSTMKEAAKVSGEISKKEAIHLLKVTPGIMFAEGVTLDDVFSSLEKWHLLSIKGDTLNVLDWKPSKPFTTNG